MPKYIIEQDSQATETWFYAVEAESLDAAIEKTRDMEPHATKSYPSDEATYGDSHEATDEEWDSLQPNATPQQRDEGVYAEDDCLMPLSTVYALYGPIIVQKLRASGMPEELARRAVAERSEQTRLVLAALLSRPVPRPAWCQSTLPPVAAGSSIPPEVPMISDDNPGDKHPWTVLLLRPDYVAATFGHDTFCAHVYAESPTGALDAARSDACAVDGVDVVIPEDYYCLACYRGHLEDYQDGAGGVLESGLEYVTYVTSEVWNG